MLTIHGLAIIYHADDLGTRKIGNSSPSSTGTMLYVTTEAMFSGSRKTRAYAALTCFVGTQKPPAGIVTFFVSVDVVTEVSAMPSNLEVASSAVSIVSASTDPEKSCSSFRTSTPMMRRRSATSDQAREKTYASGRDRVMFTIGGVWLRKVAGTVTMLPLLTSIKSHVTLCSRA